PMKCPLGLTGHLCRYSDTAYSQRAAGVAADQGFIAQTTAVNSGSLTISGQFRIVSKGPSVVGDVVNKVGRTTGWSQGQVTATCVDVIVLGSLNADVCQDEVSASVGAGDSGSPVFAITSGNDVHATARRKGPRLGTGPAKPVRKLPRRCSQRIDGAGPRFLATTDSRFQFR